jgi:hypothetical protein
VSEEVVKKLKQEYREGPDTKERFDRAMKAIFQYSKGASKKKKQARKPATLRKLKSSDKD